MLSLLSWPYLNMHFKFLHSMGAGKLHVDFVQHRKVGDIMKRTCTQTTVQSTPTKYVLLSSDEYENCSLVLFLHFSCSCPRWMSWRAVATTSAWHPARDTASWVGSLSASLAMQMDTCWSRLTNPSTNQHRQVCKTYCLLPFLCWKLLPLEVSNCQ